MTQFSPLITMSIIYRRPDIRRLKRAFRGAGAHLIPFMTSRTLNR